MQDLFFGLFDGRTEDRHGWLEPLRTRAGEGVASAVA
jgi:hypothetical protein